MSCLIGQVERAFINLNIEIKQEEIVKIQQEVMKQLAALDFSKTKSVVLGKIAYQTIANHLKVLDPYADIKKEYNQKALKYEELVKETIYNSNDPVIVALLFSILANGIDFGAPEQIDVKEDIKRLQSSLEKANYLNNNSNHVSNAEPVNNHDVGSNSKTINNHDVGNNTEPGNKTDLGNNSGLINLGDIYLKLQINRFIKELERAKSVLILGDNCGEIVFDKWMLEILKQKWPEKEWVYTVRGGPIINDATIEDAKEIGLDSVVKIVEGSVTPGIYMEEVSKGFLDAFSRADFILSKGQGNFESLVDINTSGKNVFLLLKAKCNLMVKIFNVPLGTLLLLKKDKKLMRTIESL